MTQHRHTNRLATQSSPYLQQHAHNPVDWYPWGAEAFEAARKNDKPIFLSVGYSTCYWCHVMERQCFENEAIAAEMNKRFINIKVDREQRPDVDQLYMTAVQVLTRQGGWPMSVFLTPDLLPFYGGTYFPPQDAHGRPGFPTLLNALEDAWKNRRDDVLKSASQLTTILQQLAEPPAIKHPMTLDLAWIDDSLQSATSDFDAHLGGFGGAPKFPRETLLELLLMRQRLSPDDPRRTQQLNITLTAMARGGIRDQLGGGFHRYSTDAEWLVPHFEIMLYDNAMLLWIYSEAHRQTPSPFFTQVAREIADFVLADLKSPTGLFYTALDAEVEGREGQNYLWTRAEAIEFLAPVAAPQLVERFCRIYGLEDGPNFADPHHGNGQPDQNVLFIADATDPAAVLLDADLKRLRLTLLDARKQRPQPSLDDKILPSWNSLMVRGLAHASRCLDEPRYLQSAISAATQLLAARENVQSGSPRFLDDDAFLMMALLELSEATGDANWRAQAESISRNLRERFHDSLRGGFYFTEAGATDLIIRQKIATDSPLPSGNGMAAQAMLALGQSELADQTLSVFAAQLEQNSESMSSLVQAALSRVQKLGSLQMKPPVEPPSPSSPQTQTNRAVVLSAEWQAPDRLLVRCEIAPGLHIHAMDAAAPWPAARLTVTGGGVTSTKYPPAEIWKSRFAPDSLRVFMGVISMEVKFKESPKPGASIELSLRYQACSEEACFAETRALLSVRAPA